MNIGLNIGDNVVVRIGETLQEIKDDLEKSKIEYTVPFKSDESADKTEAQVVVMYLEQYGVELNLIDNKVIYIKSTNYESNILAQLDGELSDPISVLNDTKNKISSLFNVAVKDIIVSSYDTNNSSMTLKIKLDTGKYVKISTICDGRNVHIHTVKVQDTKSDKI